MLQIRNKGEIPVEAFTLLGASTKREDESKIGFFGSGLKYAMARLLRTEKEFRIFSGTEEVVITTEQATLKDQTFERILVNGQQTEDCLVLPQAFISHIKNSFGDRVRIAGSGKMQGDFIILEPTEKHSCLIKEVQEFFEEAGMPIEFSIKIADLRDNSMLGTVEDGDILLSPSLFELGKKRIAAVVLEEASHIETKLKDESRGLQDYLFMKIITLLENKQGCFL